MRLVYGVLNMLHIQSLYADGNLPTCTFFLAKLSNHHKNIRFDIGGLKTGNCTDLVVDTIPCLDFQPRPAFMIDKVTSRVLQRAY